MPAPQPTRLFHITAVANLSGIFGAGAILAKNTGASSGIAYQNIAHQGAQSVRAGKAIPIPPGGVVHDYVPFYFAPRSPMLYAINNGAVSGCPWRQQNIVHIETAVQMVAASSLLFVYYDRNATLAYSTPYTTLNQLDTAVAWDLITEPPCMDGFCMYWQNNENVARYADRMERRQAEFLVKDRLPLSLVTRIGVIDTATKTAVDGLLAQADVTLRVDVMRDWYF